MDPRGITISKQKNIRLLYESEEIDLSCIVTNFHFSSGYKFIVYLSSDTVNSVKSSNSSFKQYSMEYNVDIVDNVNSIVFLSFHRKSALTW